MLFEVQRFRNTVFLGARSARKSHPFATAQACQKAKQEPTSDKTAGQPHDINVPYSCVATALSTLVEGIIAAIFRHSQPKAAENFPTWKALLQTICTANYFLYGIAAIVAFVTLIKTFALTLFGLEIPIVGAFSRTHRLLKFSDGVKTHIELSDLVSALWPEHYRKIHW
jgi:hypothetical protein